MSSLFTLNRHLVKREKRSSVGLVMECNDDSCEVETNVNSYLHSVNSADDNVAVQSRAESDSNCANVPTIRTSMMNRVFSSLPESMQLTSFAMPAAAAAIALSSSSFI